MAMKVITMHSGSLRYAALQLLREILGNGFAPEVVVGIARGGVDIARILAGELGVECVTIKRQRPSTRSKSSGMVNRMLKLLPLRVKNWLRISESLMLRLRLAVCGMPPVTAENWKELTISEADKDRLCKANRILVIDDAVDSGRTLGIVMEYIRELNRTADVRSAVITCTQSSRAALADWAVYRDGTLVRFPWSSDYAE